MNAREVALACLIDLSQAEASVSSIIDIAFDRNNLETRERRLANALVYGVIRWKKQLDWVLKHFVNPRFQLDVRHRSILRLGTFQLLHLDGIPPHAAIYETVQLAKKNRKTAGFINAVLREIQRKKTELSYPTLKTHPIDHISNRLSYPKWLVKRWIHTHGVSWTLSFCEASNQIAPLTIRANSLVTNREVLNDSLKTEGFNTKLSNISPDGIVIENRTIPSDSEANPHREFSQKALLNRADVYAQDESAMLVPCLLISENTKLVVDLCAAPGGKTTHIGSLMQNKGKIIAVDISEKKIEILRENCIRLGVENVETKVLDSTKDNLSFISAADAVLIDVPCSGFGTLRRHPDIRWNKTEEQLHALNRLQYGLLQNAAKHVKKGCILVYSTCTIDPTENEKIIKRFIKNNPKFSVEHVGELLPNITETAITQDGFLQTFPHEHGVDGTFAARLRRVI